MSKLLTGKITEALLESGAREIIHVRHVGDILVYVSFRDYEWQYETRCGTSHEDLLRRVKRYRDKCRRRKPAGELSS